MKSIQLTEQQKKELELLTQLPPDSQSNLIAYAAGMVAAQQIIKTQTA